MNWGLELMDFWHWVISGRVQPSWAGKTSWALDYMIWDSGPRLTEGNPESLTMLLELLLWSSAFLRSIHQRFWSHSPSTWTFWCMPSGKSSHLILLSQSPSFFGNNCVKNITLGTGNKKVRHNPAFRELLVLVGNIHTQTHTHTHTHIYNNNKITSLVRQ